MNDHETIHPIGQSQAEPRTRVRAQAKITVQSSEAKPYNLNSVHSGTVES